MRSLLREIKNISNFFQLPESKKKIVFYAEHQGYFSSFEGIISVLLDRYGQDITYITSDINDPILNNSDDRITSLYINKLVSFLMPLLDAKVCIMTLTDLGSHYFKRSKNPVHYVYVFHSLVSTTMMYNFGAFDNYDSILCVGEYQIKEIREQEKLRDLKKKNLILGGYYRLERIKHAFQKKSKKNNIDDKKTALIAPSWGKHNILESCGHDLIRLLLNNGYKVIVRPHSETLKRSPRLIKSLEDAFIANQDFVLEKSNASDKSIINSDILICDCSGIALEYAFGTERPVLFLDVSLKIKNQRYKEFSNKPLELTLRPVIGKIIDPKDIDHITSIIESLRANNGKYKKNIIRLREELGFDSSNSSEIAADCIMSLL